MARYVRPNLSEKKYQAMVLKTARELGWLVYHTYDSRRSQEGFPDLVMVKPPHVLFVELKSADGERDVDQLEWGDNLERCDQVEYRENKPAQWDELVELLQQ